MSEPEAMKPKPIYVRTWSKRKIEIRPVGFRKKHSKPYLIVETNEGNLYGYIEDRDVKRLLAWCQDCVRPSRKQP